VKAIDDVYKEGSEKYQIAIDSATGTSRYEKVTLDKTAVETTIKDEAELDNINVKLVADSSNSFGSVVYNQEEVTNNSYAHQTAVTFPDGSYLITWTKTGYNGILGQKYNADGTKSGTQIEMTKSLYATTNMQMISLGDSGKFVAVFQAAVTTANGAGRFIFVQRYNEDGTKDGEVVNIGSGGAGEISHIGNNGEYIVTWLTGGTGQRVLHSQKFNVDGTKDGEKITLYDNPGYTSSGTIETFDDGSYVITWSGKDSQGDNSVFVQKFDAKGVKLTDPVMLEGRTDTVSPINQRVDGLQNVIEYGNNGEFIVTYKGYNEAAKHAIFIQKFNSDGTKNADQIEISDNILNGSKPKIAEIGNDGSFVLVYLSSKGSMDTAITVQKYNANGTKDGEVVILDKNGPKETNPEMLVLPDGSFVIAWATTANTQSLRNLYMQKFNSDGTRAGDIEQLTSSNSTSDRNPEFTLFEDGSYLLTWVARAEGVRDIVYSQKFNTDGTKTLSYVSLTEGDSAVYKVTLTDDAGNTIIAKEDMVVTLKYTYPLNGASGEDIEEVKTVTIKAGESEVSFNVKAIDDTYKEGSEKFAIEIQSITNADQLEKVTLDKTKVDVLINDYSDPTNPDVSEDESVNIKLDTTNKVSDNYTISEVGSGEKSKLVSLSNSYAVVWEGKDEHGSSVIAVQRYDSDSKKVGREIHLEAPGVTLGIDRNAQIVSKEDNSFIVVWEGHDINGDFSIFVQRFNSDGNKEGNITKLEALNVTNRNDEKPQIASLKDGSYVVTWRGIDDGGDNSIFVQKFNSNGSSYGIGKVKLEVTSSIHENDPQITDLSDGSYVVVFSSGNGRDLSIYVQKFSSDGSTDGNMVKLDGVTSRQKHDMEPQITDLKDGSYVVTWIGEDEGGDNSIFVQKFNSSGAKDGNMVKLEAPNKADGFDRESQVVGLKDGGYVVTWYGPDADGDNSVYVQKFNSNGAKDGNIVTIEIPNKTNHHEVEPQIASLRDGGYVITWAGRVNASEVSVFVQKFDSAGNKQGEVLKLDGDYNFRVFNPQIEELANGAYVVSWTGKDSSNNGKIYTQKLNSDGSKIYEKTVVDEGENTNYKVTLTDDAGNAVKAIEDMTVTFKYIYQSASGGDIEEVKTVIVKAGESEVSFDVKAVSDTLLEGIEKYQIAIESVTGTSQYEKAILDKTAINVEINNVTATTRLISIESLLENGIDISHFSRELGVINLEDGQVNHLNLSLSDVLDMGDNVIKIFGDESKEDRVKLEGDWEKSNTQETINGEKFNIYQNNGVSNIKLLIDNDILVDPNF
ncbi:hypothetical protein CRU99_07140, partial [Malaciobacter mytili]|uniref:hypothetical protein n=1 Tax=Malaciobacter mytili TaxID=603050 RepID=UPI001027D4DC